MYMFNMSAAHLKLCVRNTEVSNPAPRGLQPQHNRTIGQFCGGPTIRPRLKDNFCWLITGNGELARGYSSAAASLLSLFGRIRRTTDQNHHRISTCRASHIVSSVNTRSVPLRATEA
jgi:hypothetical protein